MKRGLLTVVSGFSGAGKGTITKKLLQDYENYALSISATTRAPREGECHGKEYFFITKERFEEMIAGEELVEYASYCGNYYGTPAPYVREQLEQGLDVILEIEMQGALKVKKKFPQALLIFVVTPDIEILEQRLTGRGTESQEQIARRLQTAAKEADFIHEYDYILVNDTLEESVTALHGIIQAQHFAAGQNRELIQTLQSELLKYKEN